MNLSDTRIETERLLLIPTEQSHAESYLEEFTAQVTELMYPKPPENLDVVRRFIAESRQGLEAGTNLHMVIVNKTTMEFLGCVGLHSIGSSRPEFGVWIKFSAHGNGFGYEAVQELKRWADENLQCQGYSYPVDVRNFASKRIALSLGGEIIGHYDVENMSGKILHLVTYAISAGSDNRVEPESVD